MTKNTNFGAWQGDIHTGTQSQQRTKNAPESVYPFLIITVAVLLHLLLPLHQPFKSPYPPCAPPPPPRVRARMVLSSRVVGNAQLSVGRRNARRTESKVVYKDTGRRQIFTK
jgi:hypothetical protein